MSSNDNFSKFENLTFDDFRGLAKDDSLSRHEKVGFPDSYRNGKEEDIFADLIAKVRNISLTGKKILEIGPGCSDLPIKLSHICQENNNSLIFVDSQEMLGHLPKAPHIKEYYGAFPFALGDDLDGLTGRVDAIIAYSVIQYVFTGGNLWDFIDCCMRLLADDGEIFFGDIPNSTMRKRFFASTAGCKFHRDFTGQNEKPEVDFNQLESGQMDDSVVFSILSRARAQGFHAWVLPQSSSLPMGNRREDILIRKP